MRDTLLEIKGLRVKNDGDRTVRQFALDIDRLEVRPYDCILFLPINAFALLQCSMHEAWVWREASSLESRNRYTPSDCFDTFPFPEDSLSEVRAWAERVGSEYHEYRSRIMLAHRFGLTKTYNSFHDPACTDTDIACLRELHAEMDRAILACYGWPDLNPQHGFYQNERGRHGSPSPYPLDGKSSIVC